MVVDNVLHIGALAARDDTIIKKEFYSYLPYTSSFNPRDEVRVAIQSKDSYLLPSESYLYIKLTATTTTGTHDEANDKEIMFVNNFASFLFNDARYEINGVEIDRIRQVGRATTMKLLTASRGSSLSGYGEFCKTYKSTTPRGDAGQSVVYDILLPLSVLFGFADDNNKIILNCKHEIILNLAGQYLDTLNGGSAAANKPSVNIAVNKIVWKMCHITPSDQIKLNMLTYLQRNRKIPVQYRSMEILEYPALPTTSTTVLWQVKTVPHVSRPRYVILGFQTDRKNVKVKNAAMFDACTVQEARLHLNSQTYPYNMEMLDIAGGVCSELYNAYSNIQSTYYNSREHINPFRMEFSEFQESPLFAFDCSRADESLINSAVDIKIEIKTRDPFPANTAAYALIIFDQSFSYSPLDGVVLRGV